MTAPVNDNRTGTCPICNKEAAVAHKPFCSARCKDVDLGRWLDGGYAIPAVELPDEGDLEEAMQDAFQSGDKRDPEF
ncbi:MAG: DNA gyrase inhibitor YacG [Alphaproteobacteria bacterium]|jgi:uncharacterized protein|nr:DNA gyrase inhibitor YacG [Alphaproteobacteria bacterium]MBT4019765.1 DNA gyrase inhibitor YacG [Alphaproteobacteria bacterium]MBT5158163.1 DNA gyrase inhibitor YacG [Alphaproteobacteria bacterium]MBT5919508.1 DNA gyrase inhibitor YacG [Alphaproteobacteria bacterium]MBT6387851.1 DNA gyrase inhibitor YacG [Alphaproteobacteria bacterium]